MAQNRTFYEHGYKIEHFTKKDGIPDSHVGGIYQGQNGFISSIGDGLFEYNPNNGQFKQFKTGDYYQDII